MLLEEQKGLDFSLATECAHSVNAIHDPDAADLHKLLHMNSELATDSKYLEMISELLTYAILTYQGKPRKNYTNMNQGQGNNLFSIIFTTMLYLYFIGKSDSNL